MVLRWLLVAIVACVLVTEALPVASEMENSLSMIQEDPEAEAAEIKDAVPPAPRNDMCTSGPNDGLFAGQ